ncbi:MAG: hypothetical protein MRZ79_19215 [Bacteroidia bacterium]|nr:hypothetical protein [Bacteroidia bacterium]
MKQGFRLHTRTQLRQRLKTAFFLAGISLFVAALLITFPFLPHNQENTKIHTFYFSPKEDNNYANPGNWSPFYPGTIIFPDQKVILQGHADLPFFDLFVEGQLELELDAMVFSPQNGITIKESGELENHGEIVVDHINQYGLLNNNFTGKVNTYNMATGKHSKTFNLLGAEIIVKESLLNEGLFNNYGQVFAEQEFTNSSKFYHMGSSSLLVKGKAYTAVSGQLLP